MITPTATILVSDKGRYDKQFIQLQLRRIYMDSNCEEQLHIKYGNIAMFLPCNITKVGRQFFLCAAMVGKLGDIKLTPSEFIHALQTLGSKEKLRDWEYTLKQESQEEVKNGKVHTG